MEVEMRMFTRKGSGFFFFAITIKIEEFVKSQGLFGEEKV